MIDSTVSLQCKWSVPFTEDLSGEMTLGETEQGGFHGSRQNEHGEMGAQGSDLGQKYQICKQKEVAHNSLGYS